MIYIASPLAPVTGGTELLHQFGAELISQGVQAKMLYVGKVIGEVPDRFAKYQVPYVGSIVRSEAEKSVLLAPEVMTHVLFRYPAMRRVIWWLSVDNYFKARNSLSSRLKRALLLEKAYTVGKSGFEHFVQSHYAAEFLRSNGVSVSGTLSDYLGDDFLSVQQICPQRKPIVLYNPKKGFEYTQKIKESFDPGIFVPIQGMSPVQVKNLMASAAVYVDFGEHPGKDRIPREASMCGCVVLVGRRGSAANDIDVPIPPQYKFDMTEQGIGLAVNTIKSILEAPAVHVPNFDGYRNYIRGERRLFGEQTARFIAALNLCNDRIAAC